MNITSESKLFDPAEAVQLVRDHGKTGALDVVKEIADAWGQQYSDPQLNFYAMLSAVFEAGYLQGKREERLKQAKFILENS